MRAYYAFFSGTHFIVCARFAETHIINRRLFLSFCQRRGKDGQTRFRCFARRKRSKRQTSLLDRKLQNTAPVFIMCGILMEKFWRKAVIKITRIRQKNFSKNHCFCKKARFVFNVKITLNELTDFCWFVIIILYQNHRGDYL